MTDSHPFRASGLRRFCVTCGKKDGDPIHSGLLAGMENADAERRQAEAIQQAADLTAIMLQPGRCISAKSGYIERESPLFYGTGANPTLFGGGN